MSPLSIAQYLDPTNEELQFDVVIFDEASQVKPEDALGAFMRGKTAVVMGDTQQLPPTSFFDQMSDADSDEEEATSLDMESILHLCKLSFPVKMLKWHYRSRHESLITVSNREFYDDDLLVYPSPSHNDPELGLKFHYNPNTAYHRGSSSANPLEAQDVADEIFNHFEKYGESKSLGVGTFSVAQKNAILEALEVKRKERPEFEPLFSDNREERFFVKNLETIQGDERDVILISVGYGFDQDGKMSLNFGPLNQDGGERRLNVLITRAREKCVVFSNFKAYDMNLTANPPYGVKSLKEFLEYAENLTLGTNSSDSYLKEPFEDAIASFLEEKGYQVDRQIGCAGFRVDLAIVDDENPGKYILGITTDGKMYSSSKVARDRDRLREQVLTGLGWKLYHLWSTDWYRNRDLGRKKLLDFVEKSIKKTREEEKRKSEEAKQLAEKRRLEAEKKAEELRLAREREEAERQAQEENDEEVNPEDISPSDFVEVEKVDEGDVLEKPIDVSAMDPSELFEKEDEKVENESNVEKPAPSEFVTINESDEKTDYASDPSEFVDGDSLDKASDENASEQLNDDANKPDEASDVNIDNDVKSDESNDDSEVWESQEELTSQNDDAEVWESDEGVSPEDNAEVWEEDKDYADEKDDSTSKSWAQKIKSKFKHDSDDESDKDSIFSTLKFGKDLGNDSDLDENIKEDIASDIKKDESESNEDEPAKSDNVDLGSDDDYIYVDHSNDESSEDIKEDEFDIEDYVAHEEIKADDDIASTEDAPKSEIKDKKTRGPIFKDKVNLKSGGDLEKENVSREENLNSSDEYDLGSEDIPAKEDASFDSQSVNDEGPAKSDNVDLGSDDDYIYVDHTNDEPSSFKDEDADYSKEEPSSFEEENVDLESENTSQVGEVHHAKVKSKRTDFVKSIISDVVSGESKLEPEIIETLRGEIIDEEDDIQSHKPAPEDEFVVEAEIITGDADDIPLERPTPKRDFEQEDEELNIFTDTLPDLGNDEYDEIHEEATRVIDNAMSEFMNEIFDDNQRIDEESIGNHYVDEEIESVDADIPEDGGIESRENIPDYEGRGIENENSNITDDSQNETPEDESEAYEDDMYFKGANDVTNPLRKNNVYYKDHKSKSLKDSIRGIKKDMQYINKSLNEIENPTQIDYVSVVDRTEEYNPEDYLSRPSDDDSDKIIQMEEEMTFAEKEEQRISEELMKERLEKEIASDDDVIVTVNEQHRREELKDQALEDIIKTANDDYKEIEKERFQNNNKLKAFDDKKLPGKRKLEDEIIGYVEATDIGLSSQEDLYSQPIANVSKSINNIVDIEGPIHIKELTNRVKASCNIKRAGSNLKKTVNRAIDESEKSGDIIRIGDFLYDASNNNVIVRKRDKPNIELISDEEIAKSIELVLIHKSDVTTKQIAKETSRNFGFKSTSKKTASRINGVLDLMIANNRVKIVNDYVELN